MSAARRRRPPTKPIPPAADAAEPDAEVSFVTKDLAPVLPKAKITAVVALDDILMRVRDASNWRGSSGVRYASLANAAADVSGAQSDMKLAYATEGTVADPYAGFETRVVPENVTLLPKTKDQITGGNPTGERDPCRQERRQRYLDPARPGRDTRRGQSHRQPPSAPAAATAD